jgi:hypothetical protein
MLEAALDAIGEDAPDLRARVLARLAQTLHFTGRPETSLVLAEEALELARSLGDDDVLATALLGRHTALLHVAYVGERLAISTELVALAQRTDSRDWEMPARHARVFDRLTIGDLRGARSDVDRLETLARERREPLFQHIALGWRCVLAQLDGRLDDAERLAGEAFALREPLATRDAETVLAGQLFTIRRAQGRLAELLPAVTQATEASPALTAWRAAVPMLRVAAGEHDAARSALAGLVDEVDAVAPDFFWLAHVAALAEASGQLRDAGTAARLYPLLVPYATRFVHVGHAACFGPVARLLGLLAAAQGDEALALAHLSDALRRCREAGSEAYAAVVERGLGTFREVNTAERESSGRLH